ncbi:hypothetical protein [Geothrix sp. SG200]|uniref:hypothetical protein n=1 Tax=Geothrix sp. SG200 TaxID=2922865 RepID=UPI001FADE7CB|nr:hypothetical protein [Geothrix sp. SG200]
MFKHSTLLSVAFACVASAMAPLSAQKPAAPPVAQDEVLAWPPPPAPARIKWVAEYRNAFDVGAKKKRSFLDRLAGKSEDVIWLQRPLSVAVDDKGVMFVGDYNLGVIAMDPANKKIWKFSDIAGAVLPSPTGLAADSKFVYAASANASQVVVFDKEGHQLSSVGRPDGIQRPVGLAVDESRDLLVVVNGDEHAVRLYNRNLRLIKTLGGRGTDDGQFNYPTYACMVPGLGFAVVDSGNFRVQLFDYKGRFIRTFGKVGDMAGQFARPKGIAVDSEGHLYVVDGAFGNFQIFDQSGQILLPVGAGGARKGQFQVPNGIAIDASDGIYVADQINRRIQKFQYLREEKASPSPTPQ